MSHFPKVSVIMAAYNCELFVKRAIDSILQQTYQNFELLVADDGSTDQTRRIIDEYGDKRIRTFHHTDNWGLLKTWIELMKIVDGELITWQDADDYSYPNRLELLVEAFENDPDLMMCGSNFSRHYDKWRRVIYSNFPQTDIEIRQIIDKEHYVPMIGAAKMIRKELLSDVEWFRPFFDRIGWEDLDFILRVTEKFKVANRKEVLYEYTYNRVSASRSINPNIYLKAYIDEIGFFLYNQRKRYYGMDGLMDQRYRTELDDYLSEIAKEYKKNPSLIYLAAAKNALSNYDFSSSFYKWLSALRIEPFHKENLYFPAHFIARFIKSFFIRIASKPVK